MEDNKEVLALRALKNKMVEKAVASLRTVSIHSFFYADHPQFHHCIRKKFVLKYGLEVGLRWHNDEISIITDTAASASPNASQGTPSIETIGDNQLINDNVYEQRNEGEQIVAQKRYLRFDTDSGEPIYQVEPFSTKEIGINEVEEENHDDQTKLIDLLPESIQQALEPYQSDSIRLNELIIDLGRPPEVYYSNIEDFTAKTRVCFEDMRVSREDLDHILKQLNALEVDFSSDNRCGLPLTLHRISRKLNRTDKTIGLSMRFGQMVQGSTRMITDLVKRRKSILVIGVPGVGKTTLLRELARVLSLEGVKVEIVDTSNEIAGEGDEMHPSIGRARRMMVPDRRRQHDVMVEAVQNHAPECIIIDEIGTQKEARAAADITQRGVQIIGTAHGTSLQQIIDNSELNRLIGDVHTVILGDAEAKARKATSKSVSERKGPCAFDAAIELTHLHSWVIYPDLTKAVDCMLQKKPLVLLKRTLEPQTRQLVEEEVEARFD